MIEQINENQVTIAESVFSSESSEDSKKFKKS